MLWGMENTAKPLFDNRAWFVDPEFLLLKAPPEGAEWRLVSDGLHRWLMGQTSAIARMDVVAIGKYQDDNADPVPEITTGMWVSNTTHGAGLVVRVDPPAALQVMHENDGELYVEHYAVDEVSVGAGRQSWADELYPLLGHISGSSPGNAL